MSYSECDSDEAYRVISCQDSLESISSYNRRGSRSLSTNSSRSHKFSTNACHSYDQFSEGSLDSNFECIPPPAKKKKKFRSNLMVSDEQDILDCAKKKLSTLRDMKYQVDMMLKNHLVQVRIINDEIVKLQRKLSSLMKKSHNLDLEECNVQEKKCDQNSIECPTLCEGKTSKDDALHLEESKINSEKNDKQDFKKCKTNDFEKCKMQKRNYDTLDLGKCKLQPRKCDGLNSEECKTNDFENCKMQTRKCENFATEQCKMQRRQSEPADFRKCKIRLAKSGDLNLEECKMKTEKCNANEVKKCKMQRRKYDTLGTNKTKKNDKVCPGKCQGKKRNHIINLTQHKKKKTG